MHSLFFRFFILFWVAMALILGGSIALTLAVTSHDYEAPEFQRRPELAVRASEALARGGLAALRQWLDANKDAVAQRDLFILGPDGRDILGRRLSEPAARRWEFVSRDARLDMRPRPPFPMPPVQRPNRL